MQTLGAKNEYGSNNNMLRNQRNSTASIPVKEVFENGQVNKAFEDDQIYGSRNSLPMQNRNGGVTWKNNTGRM